MTTDERAIKVFDPTDLPTQVGASLYPAPYDNACAGRDKRRLADCGGLTNFGANITRLPPGTISALRHWHSAQDELIFIVEGTATLITNSGEQQMRPGMAATFPAGLSDGHQLVNNTSSDVVYLEVGDRAQPDETSYPDNDLRRGFHDGQSAWLNNKGEPYPDT